MACSGGAKRRPLHAERQARIGAPAGGGLVGNLDTPPGWIGFAPDTGHRGAMPQSSQRCMP